MTERSAEHWNARYGEANTPWEQGAPAAQLLATLERLDLSGGRALEICCGTGNDVIALARRGLEVTGVDIAATAIEQARRKAAAAGARRVTLLVHDLTQPLAIEAGSFVFAFDRGGLHTFDEPGRRMVAERMAMALRPGGHWLSLCGNADDPTENGPPRLTAGQIAAAVEEQFEILCLRRDHFRAPDDGDEPRYLNWTVLMRRRG